MDGNRMATGEMTDAEVFGADHPLVYGPGAQESGQPLTAEQQAYARANESFRDKGAPVGTATTPSYDTATAAGDGSIYHVNPQGQLESPAPAKEQSDADVFGAQGPAAVAAPASIDGRPTSQTLGASEGVGTVAQNLLDTLSGKLPGLPQGPLTKPLLSYPLQWLLNRNAAKDQEQEKTYRPGMAGRIGGEIVASAPLAMEAEAPLLTGAIQGYLGSDSSDPLEKLRDITMGAAGGKLADVGLGAVSKALAPTARSAAQWAIDNGIRLTPGAIAGGVPQGLEGALSKGTIAGPMIGSAQRAGIDDFNIRTAQNAAKEAGLQLPDGLAPGHEVVNALHGALSGSYDALSPNLVLAPSEDLTAAATAAREAAKGLPAAFKTRLNALADQIVPADGAVLSGDRIQELAAHIRQEAQDAKQSGDFFAKGYGRALDNLQAAFDDGLEASNPQHAAQLRGLNRGFAQSVRIERAARDAVQDGGVYTPKGLLTAIRATDQSVRDNATARGEALLQDWAQNGKQVLPDKLPAAGGFLAHLPELMVTAGVGHEAGLPGIGYMLAGEGGLGALYSKPVQKIVTDAMTKRLPVLRKTGAIVDALRPVGAFGAATGAQAAIPYLAQLPALTK